MNNGFRKLDEVLSKVLRDAGLTNVFHDDMVEWALFAMQEIGEYSQFDRKEAKLPVQNYRALLPEDFYRVDEEAFSASYKIQLDTIITNRKSGTLTLPYLAFMSIEDEETGEVHLMVPDESAYQDAITWYIYSKLCLQGKFPNAQISFDEANRRWCDKKLEARANLRMPSIHEQMRHGADRVNPRLGGWGTHGKQWNRKG